MRRMFTEKQVKEMASEVATKEILDEKEKDREYKTLVINENMWNADSEEYKAIIDEGNYILQIPDNLVHSESSIVLELKNKEYGMLLLSRGIVAGLDTFISSYSAGFNTGASFYIAFAYKPQYYSLSYHNHVVMLSFGGEEL